MLLIKVSVSKDIKKRLEFRRKAAMRKVKLHVLKTAVNIQTQAKENQAPHIRTGRLNASIDISPNLSKTVAEVEIGTNVEYAAHHEAQYPYLRPALEKYRKPFIDGFKDLV